MYYLCVSESGDAHSVRVPAFAVLTISELRVLYMYVLRRQDVHARKTPSIPVATEPISVPANPLFVPRKTFRALENLGLAVKLT